MLQEYFKKIKLSIIYQTVCYEVCYNIFIRFARDAAVPNLKRDVHEITKYAVTKLFRNAIIELEKYLYGDNEIRHKKTFVLRSFDAFTSKFCFRQAYFSNSNFLSSFRKLSRQRVFSLLVYLLPLY